MSLHQRAKEEIHAELFDGKTKGSFSREADPNMPKSHFEQRWTRVPGGV